MLFLLLLLILQPTVITAVLQRVVNTTAVLQPIITTAILQHNNPTAVLTLRLTTTKATAGRSNIYIQQCSRSCNPGSTLTCAVNGLFAYVCQLENASGIMPAAKLRNTYPQSVRLQTHSPACSGVFSTLCPCGQQPCTLCAQSVSLTYYGPSTI